MGFNRTILKDGGRKLKYLLGTISAGHFACVVSCTPRNSGKAFISLPLQRREQLYSSSLDSLEFGVYAELTGPPSYFV